MNSRAGLAAGVACLVVLAGCGAFVGGSSQPDVETVTPAPVPTDGTGVGSAGTGAGAAAPPMPPGVSSDGTINVTALASAHKAALANRSYNWTFQYRAAGGAWGTFTRMRQIRAGTDALLVRKITTGLEANTSMYVADGVGYFRTNRASNPTFRKVDQPQDRRAYTTLSGEMIRRFVADVSFNVTVVERNGQTYYRLHAPDAVPSRTFRLAWGTVVDYGVTVFVTPEGFVRTIAAEYTYLPWDGDRPDDLVDVSFRYDYSAVGSTTVERPSWVSSVTPTSTGTPATTRSSKFPPAPTGTPAANSSTPSTTDSPTPLTTNSSTTDSPTPPATSTAPPQ